jgi:predicted solute-binding protein
MRLFIDETFATGTITVPIRSGWVAPPQCITVELVPQLAATALAVDDAALLPSSELLSLQCSHVVVPDVAVIADGTGAVAMRTPVRPDSIGSTPVRLFHTSGGAELLARATLTPFYGIDPASWVRDSDAPEAARAEVVIVEGAEALREPQAGFSEDLSRAWFILTAQPVVSHVLLVPRDEPTSRRDAIVAFLDSAKTEGYARRREWRPAMADREEVSRERANAFWAAQRFVLEAADRHALRDLLRRGSPRTSSSSTLNVEFSGGASSE